MPTHFHPANVGISLDGAACGSNQLETINSICVNTRVEFSRHRSLGNSICPCEKEKVMSSKKIEDGPIVHLLMPRTKVTCLLSKRYCQLPW